MQIITATQEFTAADWEKVGQLSAKRKQTAAFDEWRKRLRPNDRLPRGPFFKGKNAGSDLFIIDEFCQAYAKKPFDLSHMNPFETFSFGITPRSRVTAESLARFMIMEGINTPPPSALEFMASVESQPTPQS
ncbi:hypothetical protein KW849_14465 [Pseudomonas sp. PDM26]|uniref:hypothetical protein n=1 Tax=Pseudomonas TaxID=286 RepID=UPI001C43A3B3|nr:MULTISPECIES: hypothetical protein [Pseudomonas]MBV7547492.1 hypothetical protein [Pseudomonas sp. PDM26]MCT9825967.1 hypothetical protein [Pseudomonas veronii]